MTLTAFTRSAALVALLGATALTGPALAQEPSKSVLTSRKRTVRREIGIRGAKVTI